MDWVHRGGPWTRSTGVVQRPRSMFCIRPLKETLLTCITIPGSPSRAGPAQTIKKKHTQGTLTTQKQS